MKLVSAENSDESSQKFPLSLAQEGLWIAFKSNPESPQYNLFSVIRGESAAELQRLMEHFDFFVQNHSLMRVRFQEINGSVLQSIGDDPQVSPIRIALSDDDPQTISRLAKLNAAQPINLLTDPVYRIHIYQSSQAWYWQITIHHIAMDGLSGEHLIEQLRTPLVRSSESRLSYKDFVLWQRGFAKSAEGEKQSSFWRSYLSDFQASRPELPPLARAPGNEHLHERIGLEIPAALKTKIEALQALSGSSAFGILLSAYALLLSRLNGHEKQYCLIPTYNRPEAGLRQVVGHFVNNLLVRLDTQLAGSALAYIQASYASIKAALAHQAYPLAAVLNDLGLESLEEREAAVAVGFGWLKQKKGSDDARFRVFPTEQFVSGGDCRLSFYETESGLEGELHARKDLYSPQLMSRMISDYLTILEQLCEQAARPLHEIALLSPAHALQLALLQSGPVSPVPSETLLDRYHRLLPQRGSEPALFYEGQWFSYKQLNEAADHLAQGLLEAGIGRGAIVAVAMDRGFPFIAGLLAILKIGSAYLAIDPEIPLERMRFMMDDADAPLLLTSRARAPGFAALERILAIEDLLEARIAKPQQIRGPIPNDLCYLVYTSGSSGRPKAVAVTHRSILNLVDAFNCEHALHSGDVMGSFTTVSFDIFAAEFLLPLSNGMRLALFDTERAAEPTLLAKFLDAADVTVFLCTPIILHTLLKSPWAGRPQLRVICGGETFPSELVALARGRIGGVWNCYGPSEATVAASSKLLLQPEDALSIGRPYLNYQISIRDRAHRPLALGGVGEIYIGGPGVAAFYLGNEELNRQKFIDDPFAAGHRLYRSGDLGQWMESGELRILGRIDHQVKLRGLRIELGEIESLLRERPELKDAEVILDKEAMRLTAFLVPHADSFDLELAQTELTSQLAMRLPAYMIPQQWQQIRELPRLRNGKVDRRALESMIERSGHGEAQVAAGNPIEESLEGILCSIVGRARFGVTTSFFAGGVESIQLMQVAADIKSVLKVNLSFKEIADLGSIRQIARRIESSHRLKTGNQLLPPLTRGPDCPHYPVSHSQRRMWVLQRLNPETIAYNMPVVLRIDGDVDVEKMGSSIEQLFERHDVLRSSYTEIEGELRAVIQERVASPFKVHDLRGLKAEARELAIRSLFNEALAAPFDLALAPLIRIDLLRTGPEQSLLLVNKHHIISDQWSYGIFFGELTQLYRGLALEPLPIRYVDYAMWQGQGWDKEVLAEQLRYWKQQLSGVGTVEIRTDFPRPAVQTSRGGLVRLPLDPYLVSELQDFARTHHLTPYMILLASFQILIHKYTGLEDVQVGSPIANRSESAATPIFGTFVNTIVLRSDLSGNPTFHDLMEKVRRTALDAFNHQDVSFETLVQALGIERDMSHTPLVQILFNVVNTPFEMQMPDGWQVSIQDTEPVGAQFDLSLTVDYKVTREIVLNFNSDLYKRSSAERLAQHFLKVVATAIRQPRMPLSAIELVSGSDRDRMLLTWNQTERKWPELTFLERLQRIVSERPQSLAVVGEGGVLSYRDLAEQSDRIAALLCAEGVQKGDFVGVHMERIPLLLPVLLGVMKAGAAYLPLDPHFPEARVAYYLADSAAPILISDRTGAAAPEGFKGQTITLQQLKACIKASPSLESLPALCPEDLAYVIYTSGSTGQPKGVPIQHKALANFLFSMSETLGATQQSTLLAVTSVSFDIHGLELFMPLLQGAKIYLATKDETISGQKLKLAIEAQDIRMMQATPTTWRLLLDAGWEGRAHFQMLCGGEAFPRELVRALLPRVEAVWNLYGPTETTIWSSAHRITSDTEPLYIGRPIANTQVYVLDTHLKPVPTLVSGELYIGGDGLSPGYLRRPELTAERFIDHPFVPGAKLYRTGDYAVWHENGLLECLGRVDSQIKLNGFRIEIGEIEAHLAQAMQSQDLAVVLKKIDGGREALVAYVVPPQKDFDPQPVLRKMAEFLPSYMVPSHLVALEALPLTPNLKVDYKALRNRSDQFLRVLSDSGPQNPMEDLIASVWKQVLGVERVGCTEQFFDIGGDSITANRLVLALSKRLEVEIPLKLIFLEPTVRGLAQILRSQYAVRDFRIVFPVKQAGPDHPLFLIPGAYDHASRISGYENDVLRYFANLLPHFPPQQSVYGLRMIGIYADEEPLYKAEDIAARYLIEIKKVQPTGPYFIAGECVGGLIAYELAQQLKAQGEEIAYLGLLDTINPTRLYVVRDVVYFLAMRVRDLRDGVLSFLRAPARHKARMFLSACRTLAHSWKALKPSALRRAILKSDYFSVFSLLRYRPQAYEGHVTLISNEVYRESLPRLNWEKVAIETMALYTVPGNHVTRLSVHGRDMGKVLRHSLDTALEKQNERRKLTRTDRSVS